MNHGKRFLGVVCLLVTAAIGSISDAVAQEQAVPTVIPLTEAGQKLLARYSEMLNTLRTDVAKSLPVMDAAKNAAFLEAHKAVTGARPYSDGNAAFVTAQSTALTKAHPILADFAKFLASDVLDAKLAKCAVLANATPRGLAEFAQQGKQEAALVEKLLTNDALMRQMLEADGARDGKYGQAMQIYSNIQNASKRAGTGILQRLALGTSLELAVPIGQRNRADHPNDPATVDPVKRYLHYEKAYLTGELDPASKNMTAWECRFIVNSDAPDHMLAWGREMLRNYRPDEIFDTDYRWRYVAIVRSDVAYKRSDPHLDSLEFYQNCIKGGGVCGRRAFFGRYILRCFGIPTWGVTQRAHAAIGHWTPDGWNTNFGAHWRFNWWQNQCGLDFLLDSQARRFYKDYMTVNRAQWVGDALGEQKVHREDYGTGGGFWNALAFYQKMEIVANNRATVVAAAGEDLAEANVPKQAEAIVNAKIKDADRKIGIGKNGVITIPAVACSKPTNNTGKIVFMKSFSGGMQLHYNRLGDKADVFEYDFKVERAGKYLLAARVVTVQSDQQLLLTVNQATKPIDIPMPYTIGMWEDSKPVEVTLVSGKNTLSFTRNVPNYGLTIKQFTLTPL